VLAQSSGSLRFRVIVRLVPFGKHLFQRNHQPPSHAGAPAQLLFPFKRLWASFLPSGSDICSGIQGEQLQPGALPTFLQAYLPFRDHTVCPTIPEVATQVLSRNRTVLPPPLRSSMSPSQLKTDRLHSCSFTSCRSHFLDFHCMMTRNPLPLFSSWFTFS